MKKVPKNRQDADVQRDMAWGGSTTGVAWYFIWVNYNDLTATSLEIMISKGNHPQMALIQVSEISNLPRFYVL